MMNQASQQSNNLEQLITSLRQLWQISDKTFDAQARSLISDYFQSASSNSSTSDSISPEEFAIQKKVLAKTREKIEILLKQIETLETKETQETKENQETRVQ